MKDMGFYRGKRVLVTGHTGFKGSWLCRLLLGVGAEVSGYSLAPPEGESLFRLAGIAGEVQSFQGDVRDLDDLRAAFAQARPEVVLHLAAQPLVRAGYREPALTYGTNVMGTVNVLECVRQSGTVQSFLNVTTDKVYRNNEWAWGYREDDLLDGHDPYANSKSCSELVTHCYRRSYFGGSGVAISTARAGNVIGGGDFAEGRILPDCIRAASEGREIIVRNPRSVRPYQHVLEPLFAYLAIARGQQENPGLAGWYNVGPEEKDCLETGELATLFCACWGGGQSWRVQGDGGPHEANFLKLDCSRIRQVLGWRPTWDIGEAVRQTVAWARVYLSEEDVPAEMDREIRQFMEAEG